MTLQGFARVVGTLADAGGLNVLTLSDYDLLGRLAAATDPLGRRTEYRYDDAGRLIEVLLPSITDDSTGSTTGKAVYDYAYDAFEALPNSVPVSVRESGRV